MSDQVKIGFRVRSSIRKFSEPRALYVATMVMLDKPDELAKISPHEIIGALKYFSSDESITKDHKEDNLRKLRVLFLAYARRIPESREVVMDKVSKIDNFLKEMNCE